MKLPILRRPGLLALLLGLSGVNWLAHGEEVAELLHLIKPGPGESRWMEIDWYPGVWEGRKLAAAEGKPIFFMAGSGGAPCAGC